jgi:eukaryotic-like serine/threonine-protein kinase
VQVTPPRSSIAPGAVVGGRYRLGALIGRGGMADVYEGIDERLERSVAVKLLQPEMAARRDIRSRFEAEARAAAGLSHPNAVAVYDTGEHDGVPFLVMERLPGETLADRIAAGPVEPAWLRRAAGGLLGALAAAHAAGIVHRDVKPGNILLAADGTPKISDFGIAKSLPPADGAPAPVDLTGTGQLLGTPAYLAPERLEGVPATPRSDLWAFGVVLYEALAGRKPFDGPTPLAVARAVADGAYVPLATLRPDVDPDFVAAVERAMAHHPGDRFTSAADMAAALEPAPVDATVRADSTLILPTVNAFGHAAGEPPLAAVAPGRRPLSRSVGPVWVRPGLVWALVGLGLLGLLILLARANGQSIESVGRDAAGTAAEAPPASTGTPTTAAPAPNSLSQRLRGAAYLLTSAEGARAGDLAAGLRQVASDLDAGSPATAGHATGLIISAAAWNQTGQLSDAATASAIQLLQQVPGVQVTSTPTVNAPATTVAPPATAAPVAPQTGRDDRENGSGDGKGKDKKDDD